jgi:hypothetical protein
VSRSSLTLSPVPPLERSASRILHHLDRDPDRRTDRRDKGGAHSREEPGCDTVAGDGVRRADDQRRPVAGD